MRLGQGNTYYPEGWSGYGTDPTVDSSVALDPFSPDAVAQQQAQLADAGYSPEQSGAYPSAADVAATQAALTPSVTESSSAPQSTPDMSQVGNLVKYAGEVYQYIAKVDASGNALAVPQRVGASAPLRNPVVLALGIGILILALK